MNSNIINKIKSIDDNDINNLNNLYLKLIEENDKYYIDYLFYSLKKYEYKEIENTETIEQREKRLDTNYRNKVREKYKTCMITGKPLYLSQVAHIYPHTLCEPEEKYDFENGFLLSAELHILFDSTDNKLRIDPETQIISFSKEILEDDSMIEYRQYNNKKIELSAKQKYYLHKKYN